MFLCLHVCGLSPFFSQAGLSGARAAAVPTASHGLRDVVRLASKPTMPGRSVRLVSSAANGASGGGVRGEGEDPPKDDDEEEDEDEEEAAERRFWENEEAEWRACCLVLLLAAAAARSAALPAGCLRAFLLVLRGALLPTLRLLGEQQR